MRRATILTAVICIGIVAWAVFLALPLAHAQDEDLLGEENTAEDTSEEALDNLDSELRPQPSSDAETESGPEETESLHSEDDAVAPRELSSVSQGTQDPGAPAPESVGVKEEASREPAKTRALRLRLLAGLGYGALGFERPITVGEEVLPETPFAAAGVGVALSVLPDHVLSLEVQAAYQTSIGMTLELEPLFALPEKVSTRFQYLEAGVTPLLRFSHSTRSVALSLPLSFGVRTFAPKVRQYSVERFTLGGPQARLELRLPLGDLVSLRLGPEAQWVLLIDSSLVNQGACCQGIGVGGQGLLEANVGSVFRAQLFYREAHTFVPTSTISFRSVERFLMACIAGEL